MKKSNKTKKSKGPTGYDLAAIGYTSAEYLHYLAKSECVSKVVFRFTEEDGLIIIQQDDKNNIIHEIEVNTANVAPLAIWLLRHCESYK